MKKLILFSALFFCSWFYTKAQWVSIPDSNFGTWLNNNGFSQCLQGNSTVGWDIDTTCTLITTTTVLDFGGTLSYLSSIDGVQYFDALDSISCINNNLTSLSSLPSNLTYLDCRGNQISSLPSLPSSLTYLLCGANQLSSLPVLPPNLNMLFCESNNLTSLPPLPGNLIQLWCPGNQISALPSLPNSLEYLWCFENNLVSLPALPNSLLHLLCQYNNLTALPTLPPLLDVLFCNNNQITTLPSLPNSLKRLRSGFNQLTSLPVLPQTLTELGCDSNFISVLPALPNTVQKLNCSYNQLSTLPSLPNSLGLLDCNNNQIHNLPSLPNGLARLVCQFNLLTALPTLPDSLQWLHCYDNPGLSCLPFLKTVKDFRFFNTAVNCLPNYPESNVISVPSLNTIGLCDLFNTNGCEFFWNISGRVYIESNANCVSDSNEVCLKNVQMDLWSGSQLVQTVYSNTNGFYSFNVDTLGTYIIAVDTTNLPYKATCPSSASRTCTLTPTDSLFYDQDFGFMCDTGFDLSVWSIINLDGIFHPAIQNTTVITAGSNGGHYGYSCLNGISGEVSVIIDGPAYYVSAAQGSLTPVVSGDTLRYAISNFGTVNPATDFRVKLQADSFAQTGQQVCVHVSVLPVTGDINPSNNSLTQCFIVGTSYDPNDKQVYPISSIDTSLKWLTYTVRFQNTGSAQAVHVYVTDTLDTNVDPSSFQLLAYSHQPIVQVQENRIRFNFPNIHLPDSNTNELGSHGYVQYRVKLKDGLAIGTPINNKAYIYFDFNDPVATNTTTNTICANTATSITADICSGETFSFNGQQLVSAGAYSASHQNIYGCDSLVTLNLAVKQVPDADFTVIGNNLTATQVSDSYEWWDCDLNSIVSTANSYLVTQTGSYGLTTQTNGCSSDSVNCIYITVSDVSETKDYSFTLFPNPTDNLVYVRINLSLLNSTLKVKDFTGRVVQEMNVEQDFVFNTQSLPTGIYLVTLTAPDGRTGTQKLVKQ
jgi:Leucine-rich repeat (LRR) protein